MMEYRDYFEWLVDRLARFAHDVRSYSKLLRKLYETEFTWVIERDENRAGDGLALRYKFYKEGYQDDSIENMPCSVLEMMIALAERIDCWIMQGIGPNYNSFDWFWCMVKNMGLERQDDDHFNQAQVCKIVQKMLDRQYENGKKGALFVLKNCSTFDSKKWNNMEIWLQGNAWLRENFIDF